MDQNGNSLYQELVAEFQPKGYDCYIIKEMAGCPIGTPEKMK